MQYSNTIKSGLLMLTLLLGSSICRAQHYTPTDNKSSVEFRVVNHLVLTTTVTGHLKGLKGSITFDPANLQKSTIEASVNVATISTGIGMRDEHLQKEEFFNAPKFPTIIFKSSHIEKIAGKNEYKAIGELQMKGKTMKVELPFTATKEGEGYRFKANFKLNRLDYSIGDKGKIEDTLDVILDVYAYEGVRI